MRTLNLKEAAKFLKIHPVTLQARARAGEIPGARVGRAWVFIDDDLAAHVRTKYRARGQASQSDKKEKSECRSTGARARRIGGSASPMTGDEYSRALGLGTG